MGLIGAVNKATFGQKVRDHSRKTAHRPPLALTGIALKVAIEDRGTALAESFAASGEMFEEALKCVRHVA
jgi:hypothetical protein